MYRPLASVGSTPGPASASGVRTNSCLPTCLRFSSGISSFLSAIDRLVEFLVLPAQEPAQCGDGSFHPSHPLLDAAWPPSPLTKRLRGLLGLALALDPALIRNRLLEGMLLELALLELRLLLPVLVKLGLAV